MYACNMRMRKITMVSTQPLVLDRIEQTLDRIQPIMHPNQYFENQSQMLIYFAYPIRMKTVSTLWVL